MLAEKILVLNVGSSSIKYKLYLKEGLSLLISGNLSLEDSKIKHKVRTLNEKEGNHLGFVVTEKKLPNIVSVRNGLDIILENLEKTLETFDGQADPHEKGKTGISIIGHRVVHGFDIKSAVIVDEKVMKTIEEASTLAPLHNPINEEGVKEARKIFPEAIHVAMFDTSFHSTIPPYACIYAVPYSLFEHKKIKKYGFHGIAHYYSAKQVSKLLGGKMEDFNFITIHLGSGSSATAILGGKSIDTSMGLSPVDGLMMSTRCGDIDPAILFTLITKEKMDREQLEKLVNKESGLKGICNLTDWRDINKIIQSENPTDRDQKEKAILAKRMFVYRVQKYVASYFVALEGKVDGIIFSGGVGENDAGIRQSICNGLSCLSVCIDEYFNAEKAKNILETEHVVEISAKPIKSEKEIRTFIVSTDEEIVIAEQCLKLVESHPRQGTGA